MNTEHRENFWNSPDSHRGFTLMASDTPAHETFKGAGNISVSLSGTDEAALSGYWNKLKEGATIRGLTTAASLWAVAAIGIMGIAVVVVSFTSAWRAAPDRASRGSRR